MSAEKLLVGDRGRGQELTRHCNAFTVYQIRWRCAKIRLYCSAQGEERHRKAPKPIASILIPKGHETLLETSVEPLDHAVGLWVICRSRVVLHTPMLEELGPYVRGKLGTPVCGDDLRDPEVGNPPMAEGIYDRVGRDVPDWDGGGPS